MLGYAEIGELITIITKGTNWTTFEPYFDSKIFVQQNLGSVIPLRVGGSHAGQREIYLAEHLASLAAMVKVAANFHGPTATEIDAMLRQAIGSEVSATDTAEGIQDAQIQTNLTQFADPGLVGREIELRSLNEFWDDRYTRIASIVGAGGVGKTALLEEFVSRRLGAEVGEGEIPDPELLIFLTAKDNYLEGDTPAPSGMRFDTLRAIYEVVVETLSSDSSEGREMEDLRDEVLSLAKDLRVLFALDNLESLDDEEIVEVGRFLDDLPPPSKAIITTRDSRRMGNLIRLSGLPEHNARELITRVLAAASVDIEEEDAAAIDGIVHQTRGVPLYLKLAANLIAVGGCTADQALQRLKGRSFVEFMEFSYANCFAKLSEDAIAVAFYLAQSQ